MNCLIHDRNIVCNENKPERSMKVKERRYRTTDKLSSLVKLKGKPNWTNMEFKTEPDQFH